MRLRNVPKDPSQKHCAHCSEAHPTWAVLLRPAVDGGEDLVQQGYSFLRHYRKNDLPFYVWTFKMLWISQKGESFLRIAAKRRQSLLVAPFPQKGPSRLTRDTTQCPTDLVSSHSSEVVIFPCLLFVAAWRSHQKCVKQQDWSETNPALVVNEWMNQQEWIATVLEYHGGGRAFITVVLLYLYDHTVLRSLLPQQSETQNQPQQKHLTRHQQQTCQTTYYRCCLS